MLLPLSANLYKISNSLWMVHDCQSLCMCIRSILIYGLKFYFFTNVILHLILRDLLHTFSILHVKFNSLMMHTQSIMSGGIHSSVASRSPRNVTKASNLDPIFRSKIKRSKQKMKILQTIKAQLIYTDNFEL